MSIISSRICGSASSRQRRCKGGYILNVLPFGAVATDVLARRDRGGRKGNRRVVSLGVACVFVTEILGGRIQQG
jgi:hypothetical protein